MAILREGERAPEFNYNTAYESGKSFYTELGPNSNILLFSRYIGCSVCLMELMDLTEAYSKFEAVGAKIFFVLQSRVETTKPKLEELKVPFDVIIDTEESLYKLYEVKSAKSKLGLSSPKLLKMIDRAKKLGIEHGEYEGNELQLPALFIIDKEGTIKAAHYSKNLADLPEIDKIIEML